MEVHERTVRRSKIALARCGARALDRTRPDQTGPTAPTGPDGPDMWPSGRDRRGEIWRALTGKNFQFSGAGSQTRANRRLAPACEDPVLGANQSQALLVDLLCANFALERLRRGNGVLCEAESRGVPRLPVACHAAPTYVRAAIRRTPTRRARTARASFTSSAARLAFSARSARAPRSKTRRSSARYRRCGTATRSSAGGAPCTGARARSACGSAARRREPG